jgi:hypothetical protein
MNTRVRLLSVGLLLGLALGPAWGQPHRQEAAGAPEHETTGQPRQGASDIPVDDFDRGTPRRAVEGFLQATRAHNYRRAAEYFDLRRIPAEEAKILGPQLARQRPDHRDGGELHAAVADAGRLLRGYGGTDPAV